MGEFQCYKFKTIDRPLTEKERAAVDKLSSRGHVTSTSATFIYHYSDFRHKPETVLEKYFDAMLYFANWGTRRLMFRLPAKLADETEIKKYCFEDEWGSNHIQLKKKGEHLLLDLHFDDEEGGGWMEDDDYDIGDFTPLRDNILNGDYRALYLLWAKFSQVSGGEDLEEDDLTDGFSPPPVPPKLKRLSAALKAFTGYFEIDDDLVAAAQSVSPAVAATSFDYEKLLWQLPENERVTWLSRLVSNEPRLDILLRKRLEKLIPAAAVPKAKTVSPSELKARQKVESGLRQKREAKAAKAAHLAKMKKLAAQEGALWKSVTFNISKRTGKSYQLATETLKDLKELAEHQKKTDAFRERLSGLREKYGRSSALMKRWKEAGLF